MDYEKNNTNERFYEACQRSVIEQVPWLAGLDDRELLAIEAVMTHLVATKFAEVFGIPAPSDGDLLGHELPNGVRMREETFADLAKVWETMFWPNQDLPGMARYVQTVLRYGDVIYHILPRSDWEAALAEGSYQPASLRKEGFIHCSRIDQVLRVANAFYQDQDDLHLLCIATDKLEAEVKYEDIMGEGMLFPHIYGPLNLDAVPEVFELQKDPEGSFILPG